MASGYPSQSSAFRKRCTAMPSIIIPAPKHGGSGRIDFPAADANRFQASLNVADTIAARWQVVGADAAAVEFGDEAGDVQAEAEMECAVDVDRARGQAQLERVAGVGAAIALDAARHHGGEIDVTRGLPEVLIV